ncbi:MAG: glycosyltransferase, partial [Acidimicrobiales bacterium]
LYEPPSTFPEFGDVQVRTFGINRVVALRRSHRLALPVLASAFARHHVAADVTICSSSGWAHGVQATRRKVVFCYSPARWLYDGRRYLGTTRGAAAVGLAAIRSPLSRWDARAAHTAHRYLAISSFVRARIRQIYGIEAEVLHPPPTLSPGGPREDPGGIEPGFRLCVSRLLPSKNVDSVVEAFTRLPGERLVVVGVGPERQRIEASAGSNVRFVGSVTDEQLRWLYAACGSVVSAAYEDYGLTPLEAATFGKPSVVLRAGGFLDTVVEGRTGAFFGRPEPAAIAAALQHVVAHQPDADDLRRHAGGFSQIRFISRLREIVAEEASADAALRS